MKSRRFLIVAIAGIALVVVVMVLALAYWERKQSPYQNVPKLISALQAFTRDEAAAGRRLPPEISAQDLIRAGYLTGNDVRAFVGMDLTFSARTNGSTPQMIIAHASTPDGQYICILADGSVQGYSRSRYEEMLRKSGQQADAANSHPPRQF